MKSSHFIFFLLCALRATSYNGSINLYGNATLGYYYLLANVGNPPQKQALIIDTGSFSTIFGCYGCKHCNNHQQNIFKPKDSSTFAKMNDKEQHEEWKCKKGKSHRAHLCRFNEKYLEGSSYKGYWASDEFQFDEYANQNTIEHVFGCAINEKEEFYTQNANGIIGLGWKYGKRSIPPSIIRTQFLDNLNMAKFSICLGVEGGKLNFGRTSTNSQIQDQNFSTIHSKYRKWTTMYTGALSGIKIGDQKVDYEFKSLFKKNLEAFFDTGTTFNYLPTKLFVKWQNSFTKFCNEKAENCGGFNSFQPCYDFVNSTDINKILLTFPNSTFTFNDSVDYVWHSQDYMVEVDHSFCVGVKPLDSIIFGAIFMRNYDITFDIEKTQINFFRSDCVSTGKVWL